MGCLSLLEPIQPHAMAPRGQEVQAERSENVAKRPGREAGRWFRIWLQPLPYKIDVREFLLFNAAIGGIHRGVGNIIPLVLLAPALRLLLTVLGGGGRLDKPCDVRKMDRFYHFPLIGTQALEL